MKKILKLDINKHNLYIREFIEKFYKQNGWYPGLLEMASLGYLYPLISEKVNRIQSLKDEDFNKESVLSILREGINQL